MTFTVEILQNKKENKEGKRTPVIIPFRSHNDQYFGISLLETQRESPSHAPHPHIFLHYRIWCFLLQTLGNARNEMHEWGVAVAFQEWFMKINVMCLSLPFFPTSCPLQSMNFLHHTSHESYSLHNHMWVLGQGDVCAIFSGTRLLYPVPALLFQKPLVLTSGFPLWLLLVSLQLSRPESLAELVGYRVDSFASWLRDFGVAALTLSAALTLVSNNYFLQTTNTIKNHLRRLGGG